MAVTLKDIAKKVNLSTSTVSIVLNDRPCRIPEETKELIRKTAREMNYIPDMIARSLVGSKGSVLGIVVPNERNPFYAGIVYAIAVVAETNGWQVITLESYEDPKRETEELKMLIALRVSAIIMIPCVVDGEDEFAAIDSLITSSGIPFIYGNAPLDIRLNHPNVSIDHSLCTKLAMEHLLKKGHRKISVLAGNYFCNRMYRKGIDEALREYGTGEEEIRIYSFDHEPIMASDSVDQILKSDHSAVICMSDEYIFVLYAAIQKQDRKIPEDIAVVGMDNVYFARSLSPKLTTIDKNSDAYGRSIASFLFDEYQDNEDQNFCRIIRPELIIGDST
ncbi:MAG: LacI family DNA-binding transcriptional regulator [Erysipelotrichaceae bacterium]|nr:LacI family DNA-binding transcriptional regulator [Erysipelotrichaceae bacterium]